MGHIVRNSAGVMEHPPLPAAATYRAGGRHSPTRSRPNFPDPGFKTFPKIIPDFSAIESRVRPPLGSKLAPPHCQGWKKTAKRKKNARWRERRPKKLQTVLLLHNGTGRGATSCCKTETKLFQQRQHLPKGWSPAGLRRKIMFLTSDCLDMWVRTVRELTSGLLEMSERAPRRSRREMNWWRSSMTADQAVWYQLLFPQRHLQSFYIKAMRVVTFRKHYFSGLVD